VHQVTVIEDQTDTSIATMDHALSPASALFDWNPVPQGCGSYRKEALQSGAPL